MKAWYDTKEKSCQLQHRTKQQQNAMLQALATGGKWREKIEVKSQEPAVKHALIIFMMRSMSVISVIRIWMRMITFV